MNLIQRGNGRGRNISGRGRKERKQQKLAISGESMARWDKLIPGEGEGNSSASPLKQGPQPQLLQ